MLQDQNVFGSFYFEICGNEGACDRVVQDEIDGGSASGSRHDN